MSASENGEKCTGAVSGLDGPYVAVDPVGWADGNLNSIMVRNRNQICHVEKLVLTQIPEENCRPLVRYAPWWAEAYGEGEWDRGVLIRERIHVRPSSPFALHKRVGIDLYTPLEREKAAPKDLAGIRPYAVGPVQ